MSVERVWSERQVNVFTAEMHLRTSACPKKKEAVITSEFGL